MKQINIFTASLALTCLAMFPAAALAGDLDDLEVTMEVLDYESDLDGTIAEMRGPDNDDIEFNDRDDEDAEERDEREDGGYVDDDVSDGNDGDNGGGDFLPTDRFVVQLISR